MKIRWRNIVVFTLLAIATVMLPVLLAAIVGVAETLKGIDPRRTPDEQARGLITLVIVIVVVAAAIRIALRGNRGKPQ